MIWKRITKGDVRGRELADAHYTRQSPGHPMWTRPGYNFVLLAEYPAGAALWCWWRPKWEDGREGTKRKDGLHVLECTMFRRVGETDLASDLIRAAVRALCTPEAISDLHLRAAGRIDHLLTGVSAKKTRKGRAQNSPPGACFRHAGWRPYAKQTKRADTWLQMPWDNPTIELERKSE